MADLIDAYFMNHLSLPRADAERLHREYYRNYGLAIEGLVRHHQIDPMEYNAKVDDALPLDNIIRPRPEITTLLKDMDKGKVKLWLLTNAYVNHANRVIRLMKLDGIFEGLTYCDYSKMPLVCKPHADMYHKAMKEAGADSYEDCFFVGTSIRYPILPASIYANLPQDDSYLNCQKAQELGWTTVHLAEEGVESPASPASDYQIRHLEELRAIFPHFFKP